MNRLFAVSRMTMLLSTVLTWLAIGFPDRALAAEESKAAVVAVVTTAPATEHKADAEPAKPRIELTVRVVELDESLIAEDDSPLWKLVPWNKVAANHTASNVYTVRLNKHPVVTHRGEYASFAGKVQKHVQQGKSSLSFTLPQQDVSKFIEEIVTSKRGSIQSESDNVVESGNTPTFRVAHHPLSVRRPVLAQSSLSNVKRQFTVTPRSANEGTHLTIASTAEVTSATATGWSWLDRKLPPAKSAVLSSANLSSLVPHGEALVIFSLGNGGDDMRPGKPSMLIVIPYELDRANPRSRLDSAVPVDTATSRSAADTGSQPVVTPQPKDIPASRNVALAAANDSKPPRSRQRNLGELSALRDDVRGLREDVRRLSQLLEMGDHELRQRVVHPRSARHQGLAGDSLGEVLRHAWQRDARRVPDT